MALTTLRSTSCVTSAASQPCKPRRREVIDDRRVDAHKIVPGFGFHAVSKAKQQAQSCAGNSTVGPPVYTSFDMPKPNTREVLFSRMDAPIVRTFVASAEGEKGTGTNAANLSRFLLRGQGLSQGLAGFGHEIILFGSSLADTRFDALSNRKNDQLGQWLARSRMVQPA